MRTLSCARCVRRVDMMFIIQFMGRWGSAVVEKYVGNAVVDGPAGASPGVLRPGSRPATRPLPRPRAPGHDRGPAGGCGSGNGGGWPGGGGRVAAARPLGAAVRVRMSWRRFLILFHLATTGWIILARTLP